jgi:hypothetical protein
MAPPEIDAHLTRNMVATFLEPLHMDRSVPGHDMLTEADRWADRLGKDSVRRYREVLKDLARPPQDRHRPPSD